MKKALALIAYTRLEYLQLVWASIHEQTIAGRPLSEFYDIHVFQDGLWAGDSYEVRIAHEEVRKWMDELPSGVTVHRQSANLGIALHYDFIEKLLFVERGYEYVVFCEDDLVLAPGYMSVMDRMADTFHDDHRVGMMSAHPGDPTVSLELQRKYRNRWAPMGHNWGCGISRSFWERRQPLVECYLNLVRDAPYRHRNDWLIYNWLARIGFRPFFASSQDFIKTCATYALGAVKLSTYPNLARPIGRIGVHSTPDLFERMGFHRTVVLDEPIDVISGLDDDTYRDLWSRMIHQVGDRNVQVIADPQSHDVEAWERKLATGDFQPSRIIADLLAAANVSQRNGAPVNRITRCPCGSGKRYKDCHGRLV
jgi:SEC-C motif